MNKYIVTFTSGIQVINYQITADTGSEAIIKARCDADLMGYTNIQVTKVKPEHEEEYGETL